MVGYFDDFGPLVPGELAEQALATIGRFCEALNIRIKITKTQVGNKVVFLGINGSSPRHTNNMTIRIALPRGKKKNWAMILTRIIDAGAAKLAEIKSIIGRLSVTQTSIFGRIGKAMMAPYIPNYAPRHTVRYSNPTNQQRLDGGRRPSPT